MKSLVGVVLILTVARAANWSLFPQWYEEPTVQQMEDSDITSRITGGQTADEGQFPYQAALKIPSGDKTSFCGGTLISDQYVLTAAHCCEVATGDVEVILGIVQIYNTSDPNRVSMNVPLGSDNIIIHDQWNGFTLKNDICLLKLQEQVELTDYINLAVLPEDDTDNYNYKKVMAVGWGKIRDSSDAFISSDLQFVELQVMDNTRCSISYFGTISANQICTDTSGGKSTCNGDSGGPIVLKNSEGSSTLVGITSFGISLGCEVGWPAVFTRVSKYLGWIQGKMGTNTM